MANSVQLTVELMDRVSGPARKAAAGIDKINKATNRIGKDGRLRDAKGRFVAMGQAAGGAVGPMQRLRSAISRIGPALALVAIATAAMAVKAGKAVVEAAAQTEKFRFALKAFLKSGKKADAEMQALLRISDKLGLSFNDTVSTFQSFVSAGLTPKGAKEMVRWRADLDALAAGVPSKMANVASAFEQLESAIVSGKIEADAFKTILKGIPGADKFKVLERVALLLGKSGKDAAKFVKEAGKNMGNLPVPETIKAFKQLFLEGTNAQALGATATAKQMETFSGAFAAFKNKANNALMKLGIGIGPSLRKALMPALKAMGAAFGKVDFAKVIGRIKAGIDAAAPAIKSFAKGLAVGIGKSIVIISKLAKAFGKMLGWMGKGGSTMEVLGTMLGAVAGAIAIVAGAFVLIGSVVAGFVGGLVAAIKAVVNFFKLLVTAPGEAMASIGAFFVGIGASIMAAGASLGAAAVGLGKQIIAGIPAGIKAGASAVVSSIVSVAKSAVSAAKKALGISSPSKVFASIGKMSALGYAEGMQSVNAVPSLQGSAQLAPGLGGGGATVNQTNVFETSVNEAASAAATASEIKKQQLLQMAAAFERAALELGVATV